MLGSKSGLGLAQMLCWGVQVPEAAAAGRVGWTGATGPRSCDFTAHLCTGIIHESYKLFVNPLFKTNQLRENYCVDTEQKYCPEP